MNGTCQILLHSFSLLYQCFVLVGLTCDLRKALEWYRLSDGCGCIKARQEIKRLEVILAKGEETQDTSLSRTGIPCKIIERNAALDAFRFTAYTENRPINAFKSFSCIELVSLLTSMIFLVNITFVSGF